MRPFITLLLFSISCHAYTCTAVAVGGNWNSSSTWAGSCNSTYPRAGDDVVFNNLSGNVFVNGATSVLKSLVMTGYVGNLSGTYAINVGPTSGDTQPVTLAWGVGSTWSGALFLQPGPTSTITLTSGGVSLGIVNFGLTGGGSYGTVVVADALYVTGVFSFYIGTWHMDGASDYAGLVHHFGSEIAGALSTGAGRNFYMGNATFNLDDTAIYTVWYTDTTLDTIYAGGSTVVVTGTGANLKTLFLGGVTLNNVTIRGDNVLLSSSGTITTLAVNNAGLATGLKIGAAQTVTLTTLTTNGSAGNLALISSSSTSAANIISATPQIVDYLAFSYISVSQAWYVGKHCTLSHTVKVSFKKILSSLAFPVRVWCAREGAGVRCAFDTVGNVFIS